MGLWPANLLNALSSGSSQPIWLVEIDLPVAGTVRFSKHGVCSSRGHYFDRIVKLGTLKRSAGDRRGGLNPFSADVVLNDTDAYFTKLDRTDKFTNAPARIYLAATGLGFSDWWLALSGRVNSTAENGRDKTFTLNLGPYDGPLQADIPRVFVTEADWPNADASAYGKVVPLALGLFDSTSSKQNKTSDGALSTLYVKNDANPFRYLCPIANFKVARAYKDGALLATTAYSLSYLVINGKPFATVDFTTSQGTSKITVDGYGPDHIGDTTGDPWTKPLQQLRALLDFFAYNDSTLSGWTGVWPSVTTITDFNETAGLDPTPLVAGGVRYHGALYIDTPTPALQVINQFCQDFEVRLFWKNSGKMGAYFDNPILFSGTLASDGFYPTSPWIRLHDLASPRIEMLTPNPDQVDRISIQTSKIPNLSKYLSQLEVFDPLSGAGAKETQSPIWTPASE